MLEITREDFEAYNEIVKLCESMIEYIQKNGIINKGNELYLNYRKRIYQFVNKYDLKHSDSDIHVLLYYIIDMYYSHYTLNQNEAQIILETIVRLKHELFPDNYEKIFISHREKDKEQVHAFMELLHVIGIPLPLDGGESVIFCSSHPEAYIQNGNLIDEEVKKQFHNHKHTFYILWYTDNYFESQPCLNEAGAVWVMNKKYQEITSPNFSRAKISSLLDTQKLSFCSSDKNRLNDFKKQIENMFSLPSINQNSWEMARDNFINKMLEIAEKEKQEKEKNKKLESDAKAGASCPN
ncbi:MAG: hypothetical protein IKP69_06700 [Oscillospiraceae bacterium]|nr:hypothetical protein [Oscillospiraceae bacterium]